MTSPVCFIVGAGSGNGLSLARRFVSEGYVVAVGARDADKLKTNFGTLDRVRTYELDVTQPADHARVMSSIRSDLGPVSVMIYNAGPGVFGNFDQISVEAFQNAWEVNCRGLFLAAKQVVPDMRSLGGGSIVVVGATASLRGGTGFAAFASAKGAQRLLAQSMARHLAPERIHVSLVVLDGIINSPAWRERLPNKTDKEFLESDQIADAVLYLSRQKENAWTFELDLRAYGETW